MNNINLVPVKYRQSFKRRWYLAGVIVGAILVMIALTFCIYLPVHQINVAKEEQVELDAKLSAPVLAEVRNSIEEMERVEREKLDIEQDLKEMDRSSHASRATMDIIVAHAPEGIRINQTTIDGLLNRANIRGSAESIEKVGQYMAGLYNTNQFQEITYTTSKNSDSNIKWKIAYDISILLKPFQQSINEEPTQVLEESESDWDRGEDT